MKAYTDIEQSKRLAEILPAENADQTWERIAIAGENLGAPIEMQYRHNKGIPFQYYTWSGMPCWSLAALLDILESELYFEDVDEDYQLNICKDGTCWYVSYVNKFDTASIIEETSSEELVDCCFEMILKLKERNLL